MNYPSGAPHVPLATCRHHPLCPCPQCTACPRPSTDGTRLVSASGDGTCKVWDAVNGGPALYTYEGHLGALPRPPCFAARLLGHPCLPYPPRRTPGNLVRAIEFLPGDDMVLSGARDNEAHIWVPPQPPACQLFGNRLPPAC